MRQSDLLQLSEPYVDQRIEMDQRFNSAIGADIPSAARLAEEIFSDLDEVSLGISWWHSLLGQERILIGDYLYQCVTGIEVNLAEAKLHYLEWLDIREQQNKRNADIIKRDTYGRAFPKAPRSNAPVDDLPNRLEGIHICGFLRAIGSSLDCLGAVIIGVLGLPASMRRSNIRKAETALSKALASGGPELHTEFTNFFSEVKQTVGVTDWLEWADQYRNMFVHRGRRMTFNQIVPSRVVLLDAAGQRIPRAELNLHLARYPDRSEVEAIIKGPETLLNEDAQVTFDGIFKSCRDLQETACERLLSVWVERRANPSLIEQPARQWDRDIRECNFRGYKPDSEFFRGDFLMSNPIFYRRFVAASVDDARVSFWDNSPWNQSTVGDPAESERRN